MARSEHIAIIGAGLMGHGIAQVFASKGHEVALTDTNVMVLSGALERIRSNLDLMAENGIGARDDIEFAIENITLRSDLAETVSGARFVVEAIPERLDLKQRLLQDIEGFCSPNAIFATNTSFLSVTEIAARVKRKERVVGTHFWDPPYLIPLVEVMGGKHTSVEVTDYTFDLLKTAGQHPVKVKKDVPGFVGNRLQHALWREAISLVDQGIADAATVDEVIKNSFGIRLPVLAPLETADMVGLDLTLQIHEYILRHLDRSTRSASTLRDRVERGELGLKTGKGFYRWSRENAEERERRLLEHLLNRAREHGKE
jgi:3-hydroxybutyryl-CoA dehydrogenase